MDQDDKYFRAVCEGYHKAIDTYDRFQDAGWTWNKSLRMKMLSEVADAYNEQVARTGRACIVCLEGLERRYGGR